MSAKLTVCIICKDEQKTIENCLESVAWADEIVLVDSGSTDATLQIAQKYTDKIFVRDDWQGFGEQRRRAEKLATNDWIFAIDCDEVVTQELRQEILQALQNADDQTVLMLNRLTSFCGKFIRHSGWHPDYIHRIYNRKNFGYNDKLVHESVSCKGARILKLKNKLLHFQHDDLHSYMLKRLGYAKISAEAKASSGKTSSITRALLAGIVAFIRHYIFKLGFLDGKIGFVIAMIQMQYTYNKYLYLLFNNHNAHKNQKTKST